MTIRRALAGASISAVLIATLTACFGIPQLPTNPGNGGGNGGDGGDTPTESIIDTTWTGTDSDGDSWEMTFQGDNTIGLVYNGESFDDAADKYSLNGSTLSITITGFQQGDAQFTGEYVDNSTPIELDGTLSTHTFTLTLDPQ